MMKKNDQELQRQDGILPKVDSVEKVPAVGSPTTSPGYETDSTGKSDYETADFETNDLEYGDYESYALDTSMDEEKEYSTELTLQENKKRVPARKKKEPKTFPKKKLPKLLKKKYSKRKLNRKILKKLYIPRDRVFVASLFVEMEGDRKGRLCIPDDRLFTRQELSRLKVLSKEIRKQKGRVKMMPLIASVGLVVLMVSAVLIFKDPLIKKGLRSVMQSAFGAKVDIAYLHLGILDSNFTIRGLEVANRNNTMKNLFEIGGLSVNFDLLQLLRKRFVADEMSVTDVRVNTDRETDGALPEDYEGIVRMERLKTQVAEFTLEKTDVVKGSVTEIFAQYNPETLVKSFYDQLTIPELVKDIESQMNVLIPAWREVPNQLTASINKVMADGQAVADFDWGSIQSDPTKIRDGIASIKSAVESATALYNETEQTMNMLQRDVNTVQSLAEQAQRAVTADFNLVSGEINKIASFSIKEDGMNILTTSFEKILADLFGQYYPMVQELMVYVQDLSAKSAAKEQETVAVVEEKPAIQRYEGRNIEYSVDNIPSFLIKKMHGSGADGSFSLSLDVTDISSDMDKWGKPASISGVVGHGAMTDSFSGTLDMRKSRTGDLVDLRYKGNGYALDMTMPEEEAVPGVPAGKGIGHFDARITANETGSFSVGGGITLDPVNFTTAAFEPAFAYDLYSRALAMFTSVQAAVTIGYSDASGLFLDVDSDIDRRFVEVLTQLFNEELTKVKEEATAKVQAVLDENMAKVKERFGDFDDIKARMDEQRKKIEAYKAELERKQREGEERLNAALNAAVDAAKDAATKAAEDAAKKAAESAKDAATDALKNLFGR